MNKESKNAFEVYNEDNNEYYNYCNICDKYVIERFYNNHLKSATHFNNTPSKKQTILKDNKEDVKKQRQKEIKENNNYIDDTQKLFDVYIKYKKIGDLNNLEDRLKMLNLKKLTNMQNIKYKQLSEKINKYLIPIKQKLSNRKLKKEKEENIDSKRFFENEQKKVDRISKKESDVVFNVNKLLKLSNIEQKQPNRKLKKEKDEIFNVNKILELNNNIKDVKEEIEKLNLNKKTLINNTINTIKEILNKLDSFSNKKELINNTINMFNKNTLIEIINNLKFLEKKKQELILKLEKSTKSDVISVKRFFKLADKELNRKNQESNKEKINNYRKSKTESNIFFNSDIENKNIIRRFMEISSSNRRMINNKNIHEIRDSLENINPEFELNGNIKKNGKIRKTTMRFKNIDDFDKYIVKMDRKYDIDDDIIYEGD